MTLTRGVTAAWALHTGPAVDGLWCEGYQVYLYLELRESSLGGGGGDGGGHEEW